jgi:hypothetical protein
MRRISMANLVSVVSFITLLLILVSVFVMSGSFADFVTTVTKTKASRANPKVSESFADAFNDGKINEGKWTVTKTEGVTVVETTGDNLRFNIAEGNVGGKVRSGSIIFNELFKTSGDFRAVAVVYKPIVTGEGTGTTALRFSSKGSDDDEAAAVRWQASGTGSKIVFLVNGANGKRMETEQVEVKSNVAVLRLDRINKKYRAFYKVGNDLSGDTGWIPLGNEQDISLGNEGRFSLATHNTGANGKYPKVAGRIDQVNISWEGEPSTKNSFSDAFADGNLGKLWKVTRSDGAQIYENKQDNLIMSLPTGPIQNKGRYAVINRAQPVIPEGKEFALQSRMYKPVVVGEGTGYAGIRFVSEGNADDEAASLRWVVGKELSRMVFVVKNPDGTLAEKASVNVPVTLKAATLRLTRVGDSYRGWYRTGDADTEWVAVGSDTSANFGANGKVGLMVQNANTPGKYPRVIGRFDQVSGSVAR